MGNEVFKIYFSLGVPGSVLGLISLIWYSWYSQYLNYDQIIGVVLWRKIFFYECFLFENKTISFIISRFMADRIDGNIYERFDLKSSF